jgi:6-phosphofructokinase 1
MIPDIYKVIDKIKKYEERGNNFTTVVVAEAGKAECLGGIGKKVAKDIRAISGKETRLVLAALDLGISFG